MRSALGFKKRYVVIAILAITLSYGIYKLTQLSPLEQKILRKVNINTHAALYITEADAGATTDFSYRYYLFDASKSDKDFINSLAADRQPFLITADPNAFQKVENNAIYLSVKGDVFAFHNAPVYQIKGALFSVPVYLTSEPY
ncbi:MULTISPECIES: hypothetical protein [Pantoea]|uniref:hypothetical protein n=1 Tax=Pantoea TaxID=53335 RepID=UPI002579765E|nr:MULTISPECIES: hypothetical protein [Pantoea]MDU5474871.1 hypothetical protein [Pantoea sp.]